MKKETAIILGFIIFVVIIVIFLFLKEGFLSDIRDVKSEARDKNDEEKSVTITWEVNKDMLNDKDVETEVEIRYKENNMIYPGFPKRILFSKFIPEIITKKIDLEKNRYRNTVDSITLKKDEEYIVKIRVKTPTGYSNWTEGELIKT